MADPCFKCAGIRASGSKVMGFNSPSSNETSTLRASGREKFRCLLLVSVLNGKLGKRDNAINRLYLDTILIPLEMFVVVHPRSSLSLCRYRWRQTQNAGVEKTFKFGAAR